MAKVTALPFKKSVVWAHLGSFLIHFGVPWGALWAILGPLGVHMAKVMVLWSPKYAVLEVQEQLTFSRGFRKGSDKQLLNLCET